MGLWGRFWLFLTWSCFLSLELALHLEFLGHWIIAQYCFTFRSIIVLWPLLPKWGSGSIFETFYTCHTDSIIYPGLAATWMSRVSIWTTCQANPAQQPIKGRLRTKVEILFPKWMHCPWACQVLQVKESQFQWIK